MGREIVTQVQELKYILGLYTFSDITKILSEITRYMKINFTYITGSDLLFHKYLRYNKLFVSAFKTKLKQRNFFESGSLTKIR
jgi:hypothetical protein